MTAPTRAPAGQLPDEIPRPQLELVDVAGIDDAIDSWGANCGPVALAGAVGLPVADVREAVSPGGSFRGYMTITHMREALARLRVPIVQTWSRPWKDMLATTDGSPIIVCIQWTGPWSSVPKAAATKRHFVCYRHGYVGKLGPGWVCDVNNPSDWSWFPRRNWEATIVPSLIPKRGDGTWSIQWAAQVGADRG